MTRTRPRPDIREPEYFPSYYDRRPKRTSDYLLWLLLETDTEPVEFIVAFFSLILGVLSLSLVSLEKSKTSGALLFLESIMDIRLWIFFFFLTVFLIFIGVLFRLDALRIAGLFISIMAWTTIAASIFYFTPAGFGWTTYVLVSLASAWCFVRVSLWKSEAFVLFIKRIVHYKKSANTNGDGEK